MYIFSFDIWNTLIENKSYKKERMAIIKHCLLNYGFTFSDNEIANSYNGLEELFSIYKVKHIYKFLPVNMRLKYILQKLNVKLQDSLIKDITAAFEIPVLINPPKLLVDPKRFNELRSKAYLGIISDTGFTSGNTIRKLLQNHGIILDNITYQLFSDEIGYNKPDIRIYNPIINNRFNVRTQDIYHVGDNFETDIIGARNANIMPIYIKKDNIIRCNKNNVIFANTIEDAIIYLSLLPEKE